VGQRTWHLSKDLKERRASSWVSGGRVLVAEGIRKGPARILESEGSEIELHQTVIKQEWRGLKEQVLVHIYLVTKTMRATLPKQHTCS
jgi:hypothetical protein